jgi:protein-S-isoprenylcysteine O-methyltransferase Ste14
MQPGNAGSGLETDNAGVIAPPPLIFLSALGIGMLLSKRMGSGSIPPRVRPPLGAAALLAGTSLLRSFVQALATAGTPLDPYKPTKAIVTDGPYRFSRNPAYLGMTLTYAGIAVLSDSPWALTPLPAAVAIVDRGVIAREERYLEAKFGEPYGEYKRRVRRWI